MRIGINILNFGPGVTAESIRRWAHTAESLGYHGVFISDHVAVTPSVAKRYPEPFFDAFATLSWLAGQFNRLQLGTTVCVLPYRHPIHTARLVANLDRLSDGRFLFGVGAGGPKDEFEAIGQSHGQRGALTDDCLDAVLALWASNGTISFRGRLLAFEDVSGIRPRQQPRPPVWVGGASDAALRRTARCGDAWHPILISLQSVPAALNTMRRQAREFGRTNPAFAPRVYLDLHEAPLTGERRTGTGSLEQVRNDFEELRSLGAEYVVLDWNSRDLEATRDHERGLETLAILAEQVFDLPSESFR